MKFTGTPKKVLATLPKACYRHYGTTYFGGDGQACGGGLERAGGRSPSDIARW